MARPRRPRIREDDLHGFKHFNLLTPIIERLHEEGCRHLLSHCTNSTEIQTYLSIITCLSIALWLGRRPTLRTYEMICFYFTGLASEEELPRHIAQLPAHA
jgi:hypothetical protein